MWSACRGGLTDQDVQDVADGESLADRIRQREMHLGGRGGHLYA